MKKYIKIVALFCITAFVFNCSDDDNTATVDNTSGWVEFRTASSTTGQTVSSASVLLDVNVQIFTEGLDIAYTIEPVEGDYTQFVTNPASGTIFADPSDYSRNTSLDLNLINMEEGRDFETVFDIVLTSVSGGASVNVGVDENSIVRHRVTIPTFFPPVVPNDLFIGDYTIQDLVATIGPGNGTENFASGVVTLSIDPLNQDKRVFSVGVLPAFNAEIENVSIEFTVDEVKLGGDVDPNLACSAAGAYIYTPSLANSAWDISTDEVIIIQYTEDPNGSCGGPFPASFSLTKI